MGVSFTRNDYPCEGGEVDIGGETSQWLGVRVER